MQKTKQETRLRRKIRIRKKISGTALRPRLSIFRSEKHIFAQLIDDEKGKTLASVSDSQFSKEKKNKTQKSFLVGKEIAQKALALKISQVVFDRGGFVFHGRVKALADGAREGGLKF